MLSSFALVVTVSFLTGIVIVVALAARAGANVSIARILYDTEHPGKTQ